MKHFFLFIFLLLVCCFSGCRHRNVTVEEEKPFKINGKIDDANIKNLVFWHYRCVEDTTVIDTISVKNGTFTIEGTVSQGTYVGFFIDNNRVYFYLDPGEMQLYLKKDSINSSVLKGSQTQLDFEALKLQKDTLENQFNQIRTQLYTEQNEQNKDYLISLKDSIENLLVNVLIDFIVSHPSSHVSLDAIIIKWIFEKQSADELMSLFDGLSEDLRASCSGNRVYNLILQRKTSAMTNVSSLEALDKDGTLIKLSDFEGKYILIDFWATWCVPCINGFPHLKELYARYKDKGLVVICISIDKKEDEQKWLDAIEKYNITEWVHVLSCKNKIGNNICDFHGTLPSPIPHYILIDQSGNVIKQWRGSDGVAKEQDDLLEKFFLNKK